MCITNPETTAVRPHTPIWKTIQVRWRHARHCWRSKDELISDILLWTIAHKSNNVGQPARNLSQRCADAGCSLEELAEAMDYSVTWYPTETIEIRLILSSRWNEQWQAVKEWPLRKNVGHRGDTNRCWYLVTSGRRTAGGRREKPNDWLGP